MCRTHNGWPTMSQCKEQTEKRLHQQPKLSRHPSLSGKHGRNLDCFDFSVTLLCCARACKSSTLRKPLPKAKKITPIACAEESLLRASKLEVIHHQRETMSGHPFCLLSPHQRQVRSERLVLVALVGELLRPREKSLPVVLERRLNLLRRLPPAASLVQQTPLVLQRIFHSLPGTIDTETEGDGFGRFRR